MLPRRLIQMVYTPTEQDLAIAAAYRAGAKIRDILDRHHTNRTALYRILALQGVRLRRVPSPTIRVLDPRQLEPKEVPRSPSNRALQEAQVAEAYDAGQLVQDIQRTFGLSFDAIYRIIDEAGLGRRYHS
jgi:hypothetical protein